MSARRTSVRVGGIAESATLRVDVRAKEMRAAGRHVIGFGAGEPDLAPPPHVVEAAVRASRDPAVHRYTAVGGLAELKRAIADSYERDHGVRPGPEEILVTNGGKHAVAAVMLTLLDPGDEVLLPAPYWTTYPEAVSLAGGTPVPVLADAQQGYKVSVELLESARTSATRMLVLNSPSNPTGAVYTPAEIRRIGEWADRAGLMVLSDEIYEHFVYDGSRPASIRSLCPGLADRCLVVNGVAKSYAMTGWRVGWIIGPADLVQAATRLQSHTTSNVANVAQHAAVSALDGGLDVVHRMRAAFDSRRRTISAMIEQTVGLECPELSGAFYAFPSVAGLLAGAPGGRFASSTALAEHLLEEAEVAVVPGEAFGAPGHVRLSYALSDADLVEGMRRIQATLGRTAEARGG